jgi:hypothetical protein
VATPDEIPVPLSMPASHQPVQYKIQQPDHDKKLHALPKGLFALLQRIPEGSRLEQFPLDQQGQDFFKNDKKKQKKKGVDKKFHVVIFSRSLQPISLLFLDQRELKDHHQHKRKNGEHVGTFEIETIGNQMDELRTYQKSQSDDCFIHGDVLYRF